jgi:hypothetical protein
VVGGSISRRHHRAQPGQNEAHENRSARVRAIIAASFEIVPGYTNKPHASIVRGGV